VLASLRASEAAIYGRFGYGLAGSYVDWKIETRRGAFTGSVDDPGTISLADRADWMPVVAAVYARAERRPGWIDRPTWWNRRSFGDLVIGETRWLAVHRDGRGRPDGYVCWEPVDRDRWDERGHVVRVDDLWATNVEVERALWRFVLDLDLDEVLWLDQRPIDEPLRWMLRDVRALEVRAQFDEQWVRLVDVPAALAARTYGTTAGGASDADVVLEVFDPLLRENEGRYRVGNAGAARVRSRPDLTLPIASLGAVYLGGTSFRDLTRVGRIEEHRRGAADRADRLFHSPVAPWCGTFF
jgi:predicted acetyltransferase